MLRNFFKRKDNPVRTVSIEYNPIENNYSNIEYTPPIENTEVDPIEVVDNHPHHLKSTWQGIISRCHSKKGLTDKDYGGRGIKVCDRWRFGTDTKDGFECFLEDLEDSWEKGLTLDRIDVNGDYSPANCEWAGPKIQARNRRTGVLNKEMVAIAKGLLKTKRADSVADIARELGVNYSTLAAAVAGRSWSGVKADRRAIYTDMREHSLRVRWRLWRMWRELKEIISILTERTNNKVKGIFRKKS